MQKLLQLLMMVDCRSGKTHNLKTQAIRERIACLHYIDIIKKFRLS